ncbi:hypothetical protein [Marinobacter oulmenensis]|uniref:HEAT repeat domain-containing protein n=1 Tax=Marinobacter oulmenensis TaxID=643747 RepID=A0A840UJ60_9GAMM|nr:hypothetical protein [Marinobacter oulmenensis]MBB5321166.1 hypothetical protein [Marinobacter oulmenensis]
MTYVYDEPKDIDKSQFLKIVESGIIDLICDAIARSPNFIDDYDWLLHQYKVLLFHPDLEVRGVTITSIGHLARINEHAKKDELLGVLGPLISDHDLAGRVEDAIDDINTFL